MSAITKERIELFIKNPLDNGLTRGEQMEVARIALASLEAEPVVYMWDSERKDIDAPGYYRTEHLVFAENSVKQWGGRVVPLYTAQPVPVTPDGWVMVPKELTPEMMRAVQIRSELGGYATSNLSGAYNMFSEFWNVAVSAAPKVDDL
ncbi:TPA: DUF550 domain-containing protein [Escherichia coli]|nr:DUF550 domain-containing protein [Escherichia coli]